MRNPYKNKASLGYLSGWLAVIIISWSLLDSLPSRSAPSFTAQLTAPLPSLSPFVLNAFGALLIVLLVLAILRIVRPNRQNIFQVLGVALTFGGIATACLFLR